MASYEITAPDGGKYQVDAPDDASQDEVLKTFHDHLTQQQVAADRSRLNVDTGRLAVNPLAAYDMVRNAVRGQWFGSYADEAAAKAGDIANKVTGGKIGQPYDEGIAYQREMNRQSDEDNPYLGPAERIGFGLAGGAPLAKTIMKGGSLVTKAVKGGGLGGLYGFLYGSGEAEPEKGESRIEKGLDTITEPSLLNPILLGTALPPSVEGAGWLGSKIRNAAAPTLARWRADLAEGPLKRFGIHASADAPPDTPGSEAAAEQMLADQALRSGRSIDDIRAEFANAERASLYHGGGPRGTPGASYAENVLAPIDVDTGWQRLMGSAVRASPEAARYGGTFQSVRQTGVTPEGGVPTAMGLPSRQPNAPIAPDEPPMGQQERIEDARRRALLLEDQKYHGHAATARATEQEIIAKAQAEAKPAYTSLYKSGAMTDLTPTIGKVLDTWAPGGSKLANESEPVVKRVQQIADLFRNEVGNEEAAGGGKRIFNIEKFDNTKRHVDDIIGNMSIDTAAGKHMQAVVSGFKNDLLAAVDKVPKIGPRYQVARGKFNDAMTAVRALQSGVESAGEEAEVGADAFNALKTKGEQKLFRLGNQGATVNRMSRMKLSNDATQLFETKRSQDVARAIIPAERTPTGRVKMRGGVPAEFADRPERFGRYMANEKRMVASGREVFGNSKTVERMADDEAFHALSTVADRMKEGASVSDSASFTGLVLKFIPGVLNKIFGMRQDTAMALARKLYTTDKAQIARTLNNIEMRMGRNRYARFQQLMGEHHAQMVRTGAVQATEGQNEEGQ